MAVQLGAELYDNGREVRIKYTGEGLWHSRILVQAATPEMMLEITGEPHQGGPIWWIITPYRDVYPEELMIGTNIDAMVGCDLDGLPNPTSWIGNLVNLNQVHDFISQNVFLHPGEFVDIERNVKMEAAKFKKDGPVGAAPGKQSTWGGITLLEGNLPGGSKPWRVVASSHAKMVGIELEGK